MRKSVKIVLASVAAGVASFALLRKHRIKQAEDVVLVDENNRPVGTAPKAYVHTRQTPLHRAFSVFIFNPQGKLLLQQRSANKKTWPLQWSNSCCGHPGPGEAVEFAARRRAKHELGIKLDSLQVILSEYRYRAERDGIVENEICPVLVAITHDDPKPNPSEVAAVKWVDWDDFLRDIREGADFSPWCKEEAMLLNESEEFQRYLKKLMQQ